MSHSKFTDAKDGSIYQFVARANDAQQGTRELVNAPQLGSVNVEFSPGSSHGQPSQRKQRKRTQKAMITEENESIENEIISSNNKCADLLEGIKRQKKDLDHVRGFTDMVDMLCSVLVTCQICNDWNHTAVTCPQRYVHPINPSDVTVMHSSPVSGYLDTTATNGINHDLNGLDNSEAQNGDADDLLIGKGFAS